MNIYNDKKLEIENISVSYDEKEIIRNISLSLSKGEIICILGKSGVGKTTLFNVIAGILKPTSGHVFINQEEITGTIGQVSYMLQKDLLFPFKYVIDNAALPLVIKGMKKEEARKKANIYFSEFQLEGTQMKYPHQLSGGQKQRVAFLRTILFSKEVVLLDEPFSALDMMTKKEMQQWYLNIAKRLELATLFITHDIDEAIILADKIYIIADYPGRIKKEIMIVNPYSNSIDFEVSTEFLTYKKQVLEAL